MRFAGGSNRAILAMRTSGWRGAAGLLLVAAAVVTAVLESGAGARTPAQQGPHPTSRAAVTIEWSGLPPEARRTHALILAGGPFPYSKDGTVFGNRERLLPRRSQGDYREYTVPTPQSRDRGAWRIVCAGAVATAPEACYYTDDHYASFRLIAQ